MDSTIAAALISAIASVVVAMLGRSRPRAATSSVTASTYSIPKRNRKIWLISVSVILAWLIYAAFFLHWDLAAMSGLVIPIAVLLLSWFAPIKPTNAAALALILFPVWFAAEPIGKYRRDMSFDNHFEPGMLAGFLGFAAAIAICAYFIARWRAPISPSEEPEEKKDAIPEVAAGTLAKQIAELAKLHQSGVLSDDEFARAKGKLISE